MGDRAATLAKNLVARNGYISSDSTCFVVVSIVFVRSLGEPVTLMVTVVSVMVALFFVTVVVVEVAGTFSFALSATVSVLVFVVIRSLRLAHREFGSSGNPIPSLDTNSYDLCKENAFPQRRAWRSRHMQGMPEL